MGVSPELTIVVPTRNERDNVTILGEKLMQALDGIAWEVVFVDDDSPDGTHQIAKELAARDPRVRCIRRIGRRGLSGACIEGMLSSSAPFVAVIDCDLQHDETILPQMLQTLRDGADIAVGTRYAKGGSPGEGLFAFRRWISRTGTRLTKILLPINISDPMSGFYMIRRSHVEAIAHTLSPVGFRLLLDILASSPKGLKAVEIPFTFGVRQAGVSKLDSLVTFQAIGLLASKVTRGLLPPRFIMFAIVGGTEVAVHLGSLYLLYKIQQFDFSLSQLSATVIAMTYNFVLNNIFTYADRRLRGVAFILGLLSFYLVCSFGTLANVSVAVLFYDWRPSEPLLAGLAGATMSVVFNYAASRVLTWREVK